MILEKLVVRTDDFSFDGIPGYQPVSEWCQKTFGWNCFRLARVCFALFCIIFFYEMFSVIARVGIAEIPELPFALLGMFMVTVLFIWRTYTFERLLGKGGLVNENRFDFLQRLVRLFGWVLVGVLSWAGITNQGQLTIFHSLMFMSLVSGMYFKACNPLPPQTSRLRQWWTHVSAKRATA